MRHYPTVEVVDAHPHACEACGWCDSGDLSLVTLHDGYGYHVAVWAGDPATHTIDGVWSCEVCGHPL